MPPKDKKLLIPLPSDIHLKLKLEAARRRVSMIQLIRDLISQMPEANHEQR